MKRLVLTLALISAAATAQVRPQPGPGDPRLQTILYNPDQVVQLELATGYQLGIEFAPDERIENVAVGESNAWSVTPNKRGDHLFLKALSAGATTNMTVVTDARTYVFELVSMYGPLPNMAYTVRFAYPDKAPPAVAMVSQVPSGRYRLSGAKALRPSMVVDDGQHTYIEWPAERTLPAVFAIDEHKEEVAVDGFMRNGRYVIDAVKPRLVFRLGKEAAFATRLKQREKRP